MKTICRVLRSASLALGLAGTLGAQAQALPHKPVTLVVPFAAGGAADIVARVLAQHTHLSQSIIVDNKPGAGGTIAAGYVAKAPADGSTLLFVTAGHAGARALYPHLSFDPVADFAPVAGISASPIVIAVRAESPYRTIQDFVAAAKARPGKLNCAGGGGGATVTNLAFEQIKASLKLDITAVPYKGSAPATTALLAGEIDCDSDNLSALLPMIRNGKLRALAVTTRHRSSLLPQVPTVAETVLPGMDASAWFGILAPKGTPAPVLAELQQQFLATLRQPQVLARIHDLGAEPLEMNGPDFGKLVAAETGRWGALIQKLGLKAD